MRPSSSNRRARAVAGAFWTLLVVGLCAVGGEARADCAQAARHRVAIGVEFALPGPIGAERPAERPGGPKPCTGVFCSGNPGTPVTDAPATPVEVETWGLLVEPPPIAAPESAARPDDSASPSPIRDGSSIFHPPRRPA